MKEQFIAQVGYFRASLVGKHPNWNGRTAVIIEECTAFSNDEYWVTQLVIPLDNWLRITDCIKPITTSYSEDAEQALLGG